MTDRQGTEAPWIKLPVGAPTPYIKAPRGSAEFLQNTHRRLEAVGVTTQ